MFPMTNNRHHQSSEQSRQHASCAVRGSALCCIDSHALTCLTALLQACLPVKDLDLGYNLVRTHDGKGAFVIVDHDEVDPVTSKAPMSTVYASGQHESCHT